eukprot:TRINITY_DN6520_c0_g1_i1.p1 TRINITY_DN6520_c0_g1~~TRINITY_DN6520_c0_g1_i1.p1  ORF type:complete len:118 (-),score=31.62 TRINITY_DN6520_c0_g1_i1:142-495(-)
MIVFDLSNPDSLDRAKSFHRELTRKEEDALVTLVGNKSDLEKHVATSEIEEFVQFQKVDYIETSAKTGKNVNELFQLVAKRLVDRPVVDVDEDLFQLQGLQQSQQLREKKPSCISCT